MVARYVYPNEPSEVSRRKVRQSALYIGPTGRVDVEDLRRQIAWYHEQQLVRKAFDPAAILKLDFLE